MTETESLSARHVALRERFLGILQEQGRSLTDGELAILDTFLFSEEHFTIDELTEAVCAGGSEVTREKTAEMLQMLCEYKVAHEAFLRGQTIYEHYHLSSHHDHFICVKCGAIQNFYDSELEHVQAQNARKVGFRPLMHSLEIQGVCAQCVEQEAHVRSLWDSLDGETVRIVRVMGNEKARRHLAGLGISAGEVIKTLGQQSNLKMAMVAVRGVRMALSSDLCRKVLVSAVDEDGEAIRQDDRNDSVSMEKPESGERGGSFWFRWRWGAKACANKEEKDGR